MVEVIGDAQDPDGVWQKCVFLKQGDVLPPRSLPWFVYKQKFRTETDIADVLLDKDETLREGHAKAAFDAQVKQALEAHPAGARYSNMTKDLDLSELQAKFKEHQASLRIREEDEMTALRMRDAALEKNPNASLACALPVTVVSKSRFGAKQVTTQLSPAAKQPRGGFGQHGQQAAAAKPTSIARASVVGASAASGPTTPQKGGTPNLKRGVSGALSESGRSSAGNILSGKTSTKELALFAMEPTDVSEMPDDAGTFFKSARGTPFPRMMAILLGHQPGRELAGAPYITSVVVLRQRSIHRDTS